MSNVISRVTSELPVPSGQRSPVLDILLRQVPGRAGGIDTTQDLLAQLPTELRLMIFEELLIVSKAIIRGAKQFGPLDDNEYNGDVKVPWQILLTCRKHYEEALPIVYSKNKFVFCTGEAGTPGMFWRFPIRPQFMKYLTNIGIYFRADNPKSEASKRVGMFLKALIRHATKLEHLTVMASSDRHYDAKCPWDIVFSDHPVAVQLLRMVEEKPLKHLKIRLHNDALFYPQFACYLAQTFYENGSEGNSLVFTRSCVCPPGCPIHPTPQCAVCGWDKDSNEAKPIERVVHPAEVESGMVRMMDMQDDLFHMGIMPYGDDENLDDVEEEDEADFIMAGPYKIPLKDIYEENRPAFHSGMIYEDSMKPYYLLPGQVNRYRGELKAPEVWNYRQSSLLESFVEIDHAHYLEATFRPAV